MEDKSLIVKLGESQPLSILVKHNCYTFGTGNYKVWSSVAIFGDLSRIWLLLTPFGYQNFFLATCPFWPLFWLLLNIWLKTGFKPVLNRFWLLLFVLWCRYFGLLEELWCRYVGFSKVLWCRSFGVFQNLATFCSNFLATLVWSPRPTPF